MVMEAAPHWVYGSKSSFAAGELTPTIEGRTDLPLYQNGARKIINWMILPSGGLTRRPGTEFVWGRLAPAKAEGWGARDQEPGKEGTPKMRKTPIPPDECIIESDSGSSVDVSISSDSDSDLPPIRKEEGLTFVPTSQDPTSRLYRARVKRDEQARYFDYGILDEEDAAYCAWEENPEERDKGKDKEAKGKEKDKEKAKEKEKSQGKK